MKPIEEFEAHGLWVSIYTDDDPPNPRRDWDNASTMVCFHHKYNLGDEHDYQWPGSWDALEDQIRTDHPAAVILPLYLYDHSGITMNTTGFSCRWDSGQVGFIYVDPTDESAGVSLGGSPVRVTNWGEVLIYEVATYDQYLRGDVYGWEIRDHKGGEVLDSCWGWYSFGADDVAGDARSVARELGERRAFLKQLHTIE